MSELSDSRPGRALAFAMRVHAGQTRKGTDIPYISHVLGVAALVLEGGGDDDALIAALLHDTVEDGGDPTAVRTTIRDEFGPEVLAIVNALSDAAPEAGEEKGPWPERKYHYIEHLRASDDPRIHLVCVADKLHNLTATLADLKAHGPKTWDKFNAPVTNQWWYYDALGAVFAEGPVAGNPLQVRYAEAVDQLDELTALPDVDKTMAGLEAHPRFHPADPADEDEVTVTFLNADAAARAKAAQKRAES